MTGGNFAHCMLPVHRWPRRWPKRCSQRRPSASTFPGRTALSWASPAPLSRSRKCHQEGPHHPAELTVPEKRALHGEDVAGRNMHAICYALPYSILDSRYVARWFSLQQTHRIQCALWIYIEAISVAAAHFVCCLHAVEFLRNSDVEFIYSDVAM